MKYFTQEDSIEDCKDTNDSEESKLTKNNEEVLNKNVINTCPEGDEKGMSDKDKDDLPISTKDGVDSKNLHKDDLNSPNEKTDASATDTDADISTKSKSDSITDSVTVGTSDPNNIDDACKNGRAPIKLSSPSGSSSKLKNTFNKSDASAKHMTDRHSDSFSEGASSVMIDFFKIKTFDEALTYFQNRIEHSSLGLPQHVIDTAVLFLNALKNR
jgi:hypothetical protein